MVVRRAVGDTEEINNDGADKQEDAGSITKKIKSMVPDDQTKARAD